MTQYLRGVSCFTRPMIAINRPAGGKKSIASTHGIAKGLLPQLPGVGSPVT